LLDEQQADLRLEETVIKMSESVIAYIELLPGEAGVWFGG
jgi:hypothetical protein